MSFNNVIDNFKYILDVYFRLVRTQIEHFKVHSLLTRTWALKKMEEQIEEVEQNMGEEGFNILFFKNAHLFYKSKQIKFPPSKTYLGKDNCEQILFDFFTKYLNSYGFVDNEIKSFIFKYPENIQSVMSMLAFNLKTFNLRPDCITQLEMKNCIKHIDSFLETITERGWLKERIYSSRWSQVLTKLVLPEMNKLIQIVY
jgi:hypothetical protein